MLYIQIEFYATSVYNDNIEILIKNKEILQAQKP